MITSVSGSLTAVSGTVEVKVKDKNAGVVVQVSGTHSGYTVKFEGTVDGTNYFALGANRLSSGVFEYGNIAVATNGTIGWYVPVGLFTKVRVKCIARTSGTLAVYMQASPVKNDTVITSSPEFVRENVGMSTAQVAAGSGAANSVAVSSGPGILHQIVVTTAGATAGVIIYDNATTNSGTIIYASAATHALGTYAVNAVFQNGLTVRKASTTAAMTLTYTLF